MFYIVHSFSGRQKKEWTMSNDIDKSQNNYTEQKEPDQNKINKQKIEC